MRMWSNLVKWFALVATIGAASAFPAITGPLRAGAEDGLVRTLPVTNAVAIASGPSGLYALTAKAYPGDASGNGWKLFLIDVSSGRILRSATGDAAPFGLAVGFGSVWVLTGVGAMPGGLGPGVSRLQWSTLASQARIGLGTSTVGSIGVTSSWVWLLGPSEVSRINPADDSMKRVVAFPGSEYAQALLTTASSVYVGSISYPTKTDKASKVLLNRLDASDPRRSRRLTITTVSSKRGAVPAMDIAVSLNGTVFVGLSSVRNGESLIVVIRGRVYRRESALGGRVAASGGGSIWSIRNVPATAAKKVIIQRLNPVGSVRSTAAQLAAPVSSVDAMGSLLYCGTRAGIEVIS